MRNPIRTPKVLDSRDDSGLYCRLCPAIIRNGGGYISVCFDGNLYGANPGECMAHATPDETRAVLALMERNYNRSLTQRYSQFEQRRRAGQLPIADITGTVPSTR